MSDDGFSSTLAVVVGLIVIVFAAVRGSLVDEDVALRATHTIGFTDAKVTEHVWFAVPIRGCSESDAARFTVSGKNAAGKPTTVYVCSGWLFKSATVRTP